MTEKESVEITKLLLEALYKALPFVEDALDRGEYKGTSVKRCVEFIQQAIARAEGKE